MSIKKDFHQTLATLVTATTSKSLPTPAPVVASLLASVTLSNINILCRLLKN